MPDLELRAHPPRSMMRRNSRISFSRRSSRAAESSREEDDKFLDAIDASFRLLEQETQKRQEEDAQASSRDESLQSPILTATAKQGRHGEAAARSAKDEARVAAAVEPTRKVTLRRHHHRHHHRHHQSHHQSHHHRDHHRPGRHHLHIVRWKVDCSVTWVHPG